MQPRSSVEPQPAALQDHPDFVHALAKGLEILSAFSGGALLGNQQLVQITGLPKATVSRLTTTLVLLGYLQLDSQSRKLRMGTRVLGMGVTVQREIGLQRIARPFMEALSQDIDMTVSFGTRDRLGLVFLEVVRPHTRTRLVTNTDVGSVLPLASTSIGLAYIVAAPVKERAQILQSLSRRHGAEWPQLRENIEMAHREYERKGYVITQRSWGRDVNGVGVPMPLPASNTLYAFHCAGPVNQLPMQRIRREIAPKLLAMIDRIRVAMGEPPMTVLVEPQVHQP
ncbi:MAG: IclR family transcriptional regulator [Burkholderiaceae bacterium]